MDNNFYKILRHAAILGDVFFILWITYNGIDEGFAGTIYQKVSYISLVSLLILDIGLLYRRK